MSQKRKQPSKLPLISRSPMLATREEILRQPKQSLKQAHEQYLRLQQAPPGQKREVSLYDEISQS